jgi:hypothetical protein
VRRFIGFKMGRYTFAMSAFVKVVSVGIDFERMAPRFMMSWTRSRVCMLCFEEENEPCI